MTHESWRNFEVVLTGAFLTGTPLQIPIGEFNRIQATIGDQLMGDPLGGWSFERLAAQDPGGTYDGAGGYPSLIPLVLVTRGGPMLQAALDRAIATLSSESRRWLEDETHGWQWHFHDISIDMYDFGTAVFRCAVKVQPPSAMTVDQIREQVVRLSLTKADPDGDVAVPLATAFELLTRETAEQFSDMARSVVPDIVHPPWGQPMIDAIGSASDENGRVGSATVRRYGWGKLLWLHPVLVFESPAGSPRDEALAIADPFRSDFHRSIDVRYGLFVPGIEISVMVGRNLRRARETMLLWTSLNWAYYALFMEIDRGLFARLDAAIGNHETAVSALEREARTIFEHNLRVESVKTRLQSILMDMGGGALTLWETVAGAQRLETLIGTVDAKLELLQRLSERRLHEATAARDKRISTVLYMLSAMTAVTVVAAVIGTVIGSPTFRDAHLALRYILTGLGFLIAFGLFLAGSQWRPKRTRREKSTPAPLG